MENTICERASARSFFTQPLSTLGLAAGIMMGAAEVSAAPIDASDMSINGAALSTLLDSNGQVPITASVNNTLRYTGYAQSCSDAEWFIKLDGSSKWVNFDHTKYAEGKLFRAGNHQLKLTVEGYTNWLTLCFHSGEYSEQIVDLKVSSPGYTQTQYPIMVVPGVLAYDSINLLFLNNEYFYGVADAIGEDSDQQVHTFSLNPWEDTVPRGEDLAKQIITTIVNSTADDLNDDAEHSHVPHVPFNKVNLLAHSHGSTTSRVAINWLKNEGIDNVASLTTVAGPHYGTPTADGAKYALDNWGLTGDLLEMVLVPGFEFLGDVIAMISGHPEYIGEGDLMSVLMDFTQEDMYQFNQNYPSYGLPAGGKYYSNEIADTSVTTDTFYEAYGRGVYESWIDGAQKEYNVVQADGSVVNQNLVIGNGLGNEADINAENAVQYYSFGGTASWNSVPNDVLGGLPSDPLDPVLAIFNSFYGVLYENQLSIPKASDFEAGSPEYIPHDSFIPESSSKFGRYVSTYHWNHVDEQNALLGIVPSEDDNGAAVASPITVYRMHANRLQRAGL